MRDEGTRLAFFFTSPRHFDFSNCETETLKCFKDVQVLRCDVI